MSDLVSLILRNIGQCDVNRIMTSSIKTITSVLNDLTYMISLTEMIAMNVCLDHQNCCYSTFMNNDTYVIFPTFVLIWMSLIYLKLVSWQLADMFKVMWRWTDKPYSTVYDIPTW